MLPSISATGMAPSSSAVVVAGRRQSLGACRRDITGDSLPDVLVSDEVSNSVVLYKSLGANQRFRQADASPVSRRPISAAVADFDGDGRYDGAAADDFVRRCGVGLDQHRGAVGDHPGGPARRRQRRRRGERCDAVAVMRELGDATARVSRRCDVAVSLPPRPALMRMAMGW